jgi:hypothetical protein
LLVLPWSSQATAREDSGYQRTVDRVLKLLPKRPARVVIVDAKGADDEVRSALQRIDAFITKDARVVYLTSHSAVLQGALKEWALHEHILAAIIWHEMAHIEGADEAEAQRREETLLTDYIIRERVDRVEGMRYLATLRSRRGRDGKLAEGNIEETVKARALENPIAVIECTKPSCDP